MTPNQICLVRATWAEVAPEAAADLFYARLFELAPQLRGLFPHDLSAQGGKLMAAISAVVKSRHDLNSILPTVRELGRRHAAYGAEAAHYDVVGDALLWTLRTGLGETVFTAEAREAWATVYNLLAATMIEAAEFAGCVISR